MPEVLKRKFEFDAMEHQWLRQAVASQRAILVRKRSTETPGSEIYELRSKEISALDALSAKVA